MKSLSITLSPSISKSLELRARLLSQRPKKGNSKLIAIGIKIEAPRINEDNLTPEERAIVKFFLQCFGKKHLNLEGIVRVDAKAARKYLGLFPFFIWHLFCFYIYIPLLTSAVLADEMALKTAMAEFRRHILKKSYKGDGSSSPRSASFGDLKFSWPQDLLPPRLNLKRSRRERKWPRRKGHPGQH